MKVTQRVFVEADVDVEISHEEIVAAIRDDKNSVQGVCSGFSDFIRYSKAIPDEILAQLNDSQRKIIASHLRELLERLSVQQEGTDGTNQD